MADAQTEQALRYAGARIEGAVLPSFVSEQSGESHAENMQTLTEAVEARSLALLNEMRQPLDQQSGVYGSSLDFASAFARRRDYRTRYGTAYWRRARAARSRQTREFIRLVHEHYAPRKQA